ncbi:S-adenosyl-L-methionine-dependent methyltransferase, partial [Syncephalis fuscata]
MSSLHTVSYDSADYWDERFRQETQFEWLVDFRQLKPILLGAVDEEDATNGIITSSDRILHVGCGSSQLGIELARAGCDHVINTDLSAVAIEKGQMASHTLLSPELCSRVSWLQSNVLDMHDTICDDSVDVILDKSVMDAVACGDLDTTVCVRDGAGNSYSIAGAAHAQMAEEAGRVLRPGGRWIIISYSANRPIFHSSPVANGSDRSADLSWRWQSDPIRQIEVPSSGNEAVAANTPVSRPLIYHYMYVHRKLPL